MVGYGFIICVVLYGIFYELYVSGTASGGACIKAFLSASVRTDHFDIMDGGFSEGSMSGGDE